MDRDDDRSTPPVHDRLDIHLYLHDESAGPRVTDLLDQILTRLGAIERKEQQIMTQNDQILDFSARLNTSTNKIAATLKELRAEVANGAASPESLAALDANIKALEALGADPANPVPTV